MVNVPFHIPTLDGWRAVAIGIVVLSHFAETWIGGRVGEFATRLGGQGVAIFFAISGYLITSLLLQEQEKTGRIGLASFYVKRSFRILPAAFVFLLMLALLEGLGLIKLAPGELLAGAVFYSNYWPSRSWFTAHFWSLSVEEHFYLIWPCMLALGGPKRALWIALGLVAATLIWRPFGLEWDLGVNAIQRTDVRLDAFLWAGAAALLLNGWDGAWLTRVRWVGPAAGFLLLAANLAALANPGNGWKLAKEAAQAAVFPWLIISTVYRPEALLGKILELPALKWVGRLSYSIYLWQELFLTHLVPGSAALKLVLVLVAAGASYYTVQQPFRNLGRRLISR